MKQCSKRKLKNISLDVSIELVKIAYQNIANKIININSSLEIVIPQKLKITLQLQRNLPTMKITGRIKPFNTLSAIMKMLKKVVCRQYLDYFDERNFLVEFRSGCKVNYSCNAALQFLLHLQKNKQLNIIVVSLDFKRAFKAVNLDRFIMKT